MGAGLLAKAVNQLAYLLLTHRIREQARSHRSPLPQGICDNRLQQCNHNNKGAHHVTTPDTGFAEITQRELGLRRQLTSGQMSMIAIGGAIGTGLFMGSAYAIGYAGPSVLVSYAIGALITLLLMGCLAEMTVAHSTSGSFGAYAEFYISPLAGFLVRYAYWAAIVLAVGAEVKADHADEADQQEESGGPHGLPVAPEAVDDGDEEEEGGEVGEQLALDLHRGSPAFSSPGPFSTRSRASVC